MFSDAINSISSRCRPSSLPIASASSGSDSASEAEKNGSAADFGFRDITLSWRREKRRRTRKRAAGLRAGLAHRGFSAKEWEREVVHDATYWGRRFRLRTALPALPPPPRGGG